jgi:diadenosine tetraphosphatase ApaH/serine/threonine PP2A family protein phosphatase
MIDNQRLEIRDILRGHGVAFSTILGDVHGNLPALQAVISAAGDGAEGWACIGDTVGYGPYPNECLSLVRGLDSKAVAGNHDLGSLGAIDLSRFNMDARLACEWTGGTLELDGSAYLGSLPQRLDAGECLLVHGSPRDPVWEYVLTPNVALACFSAFSQHTCFHGHSHQPAVFRLRQEDFEEGRTPALDLILPQDGEVIELAEGFRFLVNVGSVGQPRDADPRACYVEYDRCAGTVTYRRVEYPILEVQQRMEEVGLPRFLIERLSLGR